MSGQISLDYPFVNSWLWETEVDTIWVSMIEVDDKERRKGHTRRLLEQLMKKYRKVIVPNPSRAMLNLLVQYGFKHNPDLDPDIYDLWILEKEARS